MRIVVVEDEIKTREGLLSIIDRFTDYEIVGTAANGIEGVEMIQSVKPDLVISDIRMPQMDGLTMLQALKDAKVKAETVLLTGYSEFEYARKALTLGVTEYLLKPVDVEEFLKVMDRVKTKIDKNKVEKVSVHQLLWSYLTERESDRKEIYPVLCELLQVNEKIEVSLFLIKPCSIANETATEMMEMTKNLLNSLCMENYFILFLSQNQGFLVMVLDTARNHFLKMTFERKILGTLKEISDCFCTYATIHGISGLSHKLEEMQSLFKHAFSFPCGTVLEQSMIEDLVYDKIEYPEQLEQSILREMRNGNTDKILAVSSQFEQNIILSGADPECIMEYTVRFAAGVLRIAGERKTNWNNEDGTSYLIADLTKNVYREELLQSFHKLMEIAVSREDVPLETENGMILNVIAYIRENYARDISLSEVASICGVTPEYLSKIFYREVNVNFTAFLQNFRISLAKRLLAAGKYKVSEISESVGFHDPKYFIKVFKKITGITPSEYKKEIK